MTDDRPVLDGDLASGDLVTEVFTGGARQDVWLVDRSEVHGRWLVRQANGFVRLSRFGSNLLRRRAARSREEAQDTVGDVLTPGSVRTFSVGGQQVSVAVGTGGPDVEVIVRLAQRAPLPPNPADPAAWR